MVNGGAGPVGTGGPPLGTRPPYHDPAQFQRRPVPSGVHMRDGPTGGPGYSWWGPSELPEKLSQINRSPPPSRVCPCVDYMLIKLPTFLYMATTVFTVIVTSWLFRTACHVFRVLQLVVC